MGSNIQDTGNTTNRTKVLSVSTARAWPVAKGVPTVELLKEQPPESSPLQQTYTNSSTTSSYTYTSGTANIIYNEPRDQWVVRGKAAGPDKYFATLDEAEEHSRNMMMGGVTSYPEKNLDDNEAKLDPYNGIIRKHKYRDCWIVANPHTKQDEVYPTQGAAIARKVMLHKHRETINRIKAIQAERIANLTREEADSLDKWVKADTPGAINPYTGVVNRV